MSRLFDALDERFDDLDEVKDVAEHGCSGGVGGFIYYSETRAFFFEHEDEIEGYIDTIYGGELLHLLIKDDAPTINNLINSFVWCVVEDYCRCRWGKHEDSRLDAA